MNQAAEQMQPEPGVAAMKRFIDATAALFSTTRGSTLEAHLHDLAHLAHSDLVLLYEAGTDATEFELVAGYGLPEVERGRFEQLGLDETIGAGGIRTPSTSDPAPVGCDPMTQDLLALGIRAYWGYPLWADGSYVGRLFFGSRRWDAFHDNTLALFAATSAQLATVLRLRRSAHGGPGSPSRVSRAAAGPNSDGMLDERAKFIAVLAHELRNPIAPLRSGLDLLSTGLLDDEGRRDTTDMMQRQLVALVRLIDDLLDTVRLSTGRMRAKKEAVGLAEVLEAAVESIRPALESKEQRLVMAADSFEVVLDADAVRLTQAFVNILSANVKETPVGGKVSIVVSRDSSHVTVRFEDHGEGIDENEMGKVFDLFPEAAASTRGDGLGVGLSLVRGLVELNDGTVYARNRHEGHGAVYSVRLPMSSLALPQRSAQDSADRADALRSHRLLIVDDNEAAAETLGLLFELDGHTVRLAKDGPTALQEAVEFQPEVILLDIGLPGFNGLEAAKRIRASETLTRPLIIALTGWGTEDDRRASEAAGCDLHLVKPVAHAQLRDAIGRLTLGRVASP